MLRNGKASTLAVVNAVKAAMPKIMASLPPELNVRQLFDQSLFVRAAINGVVREAVMAAFLTGMMILLFLGSWRSTVIVCVSIPLSILTSLICLSLLGQTINVMTLGGMALAVGILVDDATVAIENIHRNMGMKKSLVRAVLDGSQQIATPAFVSTLSICIVFVPVLLLTGAAKFLFTPMAMAVVFAMLASYFLSRTLVATMAHHMLGADLKHHAEEGGHARVGPFRAIHLAFNRGFENMRGFYAGLLHGALDHPVPVLACFVLFVGGSLWLAPLIGRDFFPTVDSGQMRLHARRPSGTRLEETEVYFANIEREIRQVIPENEVDTIIDTLGIPMGGINLAYGDATTIGPGDGDILVAMKPEHGPTADYVDRVRRRLHERFPDVVFFFEPANITNQILNFGLPAPIDVQVVGRNQTANYEIARQMAVRISAIPGAADVHVHQVVDWPEIHVDVNRDMAEQAGMTQKDVSSNLLISLSSSGQVAPTQWLDWSNGVSYSVAVQTPQYRLNSVEALLRTPINTLFSNVAASTPNAIEGAANAGLGAISAGPSQSSLAYGNPGAMAGGPQMLANLATVSRKAAPEIINHYNVTPVYDVYANVDRRDLGGVGGEVEKIASEFEHKLPRGSSIEVRGQIRPWSLPFTAWASASRSRWYWSIY